MNVEIEPGQFWKNKQTNILYLISSIKEDLIYFSCFGDSVEVKYQEIKSVFLENFKYFGRFTFT